jgi:hypothetical protein
MVGQNGAETAMVEPGPVSDETQKRERSSIGFPYMHLDDVMEVAAAIHDNVGTGTCSSDQLAVWLKQSPSSSAFRIRLSAARLFGLIDTERTDAIKLTELGRLAVDPKREREARATAFLNVPLYRALYEKFKGSVLPPTAALEREIASLGVAEKQKDRARQVFERSAEQAAFFEHGKDRLVLPGIAVLEGQKPKEDVGGGGGSGGGELDLDPLLVELLKKIPPPDQGWPADKRVRWFRTFAMNVSQIYDDDNAPVELKIAVQGSTQD